MTLAEAPDVQMRFRNQSYGSAEQGAIAGFALFRPSRTALSARADSSLACRATRLGLHDLLDEHCVTRQLRIALSTFSAPLPSSDLLARCAASALYAHHGQITDCCLSRTTPTTRSLTWDYVMKHRFNASGGTR